MGIQDRCEMTWQANRKRWRKIHKGQLFQATCEELGCPATKEASYRQANDWWRRKRAELESTPTHPLRPQLELLERRIEWAKENGGPDMVEHLTVQHNIVESLDKGDEEVAQTTIDFSPYAGFKLWDAEKTQTNKTIAAQIEAYILLERSRLQSEMLSVSEYDTVRRCLHEFRDWVGGSKSIECLDAERVEAWWSCLLGQKISVEYKKKKLRFAKSFIHWLVEKGQIPIPPNLQSRRHRFGGGAKTISTIPVDHARDLILAASGQLRLHLLLMANCGMTQQDVSNLKPTEIDWTEGRIKRKRSKTEEHEDVPIVDYPLWPETWELLQRYGRRTGDYALMTESGRTWVRDFIKEDGKRSKVDAIKSNYIHLLRKTRLSYSMKLFRKTSATLLEEDYSDNIVTQFLGHAPNTVATRHYSAPSQAKFDRAVLWLRERLKLSNPSQG